MCELGETTARAGLSGSGTPLNSTRAFKKRSTGELRSPLSSCMVSWSHAGPCVKKQKHEAPRLLRLRLSEISRTPGCCTLGTNQTHVDCVDQQQLTWPLANVPHLRRV